MAQERDQSRDGRPKCVVLDSTVMNGRDRYLESTAARVLLEEARAGRVELFVPEVVMVEAAANHERASREAQQALVRSHNVLAGLRQAQPDVRPLNLTYRDDLGQVFARARARVAPLPQVAHDRILERAVSRRRPFDRSGRVGYQDCLVWETVLALLADGHGPIALISNDHGAFSEAKDEAQLADELREDLVAAGQDPSAVELFFELKHYTTGLKQELLPPLSRDQAGLMADAVLEQWQQRIHGDDSFRSRLYEALAQTATRDIDTLAGPDFVRAPGVRPHIELGRFTDMTANESYVNQTATIIEVTVHTDFELVLEVDPDAPPPPYAYAWQAGSALASHQGLIELTFDVYTHAPDHSDFEPRLVGWSTATEGPR